MKSGNRSLWALLDRIDVIGWVAVVVAILWILLSVFNVKIPWLTDALPQSLLFVLGALVIYLHRVLEEIRQHTTRESAELIIGNDEIYRAATLLIKKSPPHARFWATSLWPYESVREETSGFAKYFQTLLGRLQREREAQYLRAVCANTAETWALAKKRVLEILPLQNAQCQFYFTNPLVVDCLIGENEAILGIPDRATFPHLRAAFLIRNPTMVDSLRQWYKEFIWDAPVEKLEVGGEADLEEIEKRKGWRQ